MLVAGALATPAAANMLPPLYYMPPFFGAVFIVPIVLVESVVLHLYLRRDAATVFATVLAANLLTLVAGIFVALLADAFLYDLVANRASEGGFMGDVARSLRGTENPRAAADITALLLVNLVHFVSSALLEAPVLYLVLRRRMAFGRATAVKASLLANAASYTLLSIFDVYLAWEYY